MFARFTHDARAAVSRAVDDATPTSPVDSTALLLALAALADEGDTGPGSVVLRDAGLDRARLATAARAGAPTTADGTTADGTTAGTASADVLDAELDADALASLGIDLDAVRAHADAVFGAGALDAPAPSEARRGRRPRGRLTSDAKRALELALREAGRLHDKQLTSAHLLLGLLRDADSPASRTLAAASADVPALRAAAERARDRRTGRAA
ncbi:Clp protease N-terminal domain-containing protein [Luteimicrobium subarcticum]|uniref:ClpA/ClpB-like protein n=1 Tax=Luteimicrobium subarcticum TaxID=620910 RepID=A0A2M8WV64_9MICO|nr:Clp protease N-terminal domain-containing protein [Luteimicrobium subarcticum]PJI94814.1 ClpA/ClpB-like protein [Luteimicrobium subarcticum]